MVTPRLRESPAKRLAFFNHKGGVGKTTITLNVAFELAGRGIKTLIVDTDPQCNLSAFCLLEPNLDELLDKSDTAEGKTLWTSLRPIVEGEGLDAVAPVPIQIESNLHLMVGDVRLAEYERELSSAWGECFQLIPRALRITTALSSLVDRAAAAVGAEVVFFDSGPNIGPLNRVILLDCDAYAVPAACDVFSTRALKTLGQTMYRWIRDWRLLSGVAPERSIGAIRGRPRLLGLVPQGFKTYAGEMAAAPQTFMSKLDRAMNEDMIGVLRPLGAELVPESNQKLVLGVVKYLGTVVSESQRSGSPVSRIAASAARSGELKELFGSLADEIVMRAHIRT